MNKYKIVAILVDGRVIETFFMEGDDDIASNHFHCAVDALYRRLSLEDIDALSVKQWNYYKVETENN